MHTIWEVDLVVCVCPADCPRSSADGSEVNVIGNAGPVQLPSGRILLPFCRNNHDTLLSYSDDDGVSWATPTNFTASVMPSPPVRAPVSAVSGPLHPVECPATITTHHPRERTPLSSMALPFLSSLIVAVGIGLVTAHPQKKGYPSEP